MEIVFFPSLFGIINIDLLWRCFLSTQVHFATINTHPPTSPALFLFLHTPVNDRFQGKRKEIRSTVCRELLTSLATQQEIN